MPIIKSAKKRVRVAAKAAIRNSKTKRALREALKDFHSALASGKTDKINDSLKNASSAIDKAAKMKVIHKNKAARKKHQLSETIKRAGLVTNSSKKLESATKKTTKPTAKKLAVKTVKPTTKKPVIKKPSGKK